MRVVDAMRFGIDHLNGAGIGAPHVARSQWSRLRLVSASAVGLPAASVRATSRALSSN